MLVLLKVSWPRGLSGRDRAGRVVRDRQRLAALLQILGVGRQGLLDSINCLFACGAETDDTRQIGQVRTPAAIFGLFIDHDVLAHRRFSRLVARLMLLSVPAGTVSLPLPATTIRSARSGCAQTS